MPKTTLQQLPKELLEAIYAEVETRVERKYRDRIDALERKVDEFREEAKSWRHQYLREAERSQDLRDDLSLARSEIKDLREVVEKQRVQIEGLQKQLRGRKSEVAQIQAPIENEAKRARGGQHGRKGYGRKRRDELETEECVHDFEPAERLCPKCGRAYEDIGSKSSEEIRVTFRVVRVIHRRKTIRRGCSCADVPTIKTASIPPKLFEGTLFSTEFWQYIIYDKYHLQRPLNKVRDFLKSHGLEVSQGTLTNGLKRLHDRKVFKPLVEEIAARVSSATDVQMDETSWKVFQEIEGKKGFLHWFWVKLASDCTLFNLDPSRSRKAAKRDLNTEPVVVVSDMLAAYKNLGDNVTNAWCWAHVRRYVLKLLLYPELKKSAQLWVNRIDWIYHCNNQRIAAKTDAEYQKHDAALRAAMDEFERLAKSYAKRARHAEAKKVFKLIATHWEGLCVFVEQETIPMDNNASERALRRLVNGRKNYYGSGACWSGEFAADLFSIFATVEMNGMNVRTWLLEYLSAVAENGGYAPVNAKSFLPWNSPPLNSLHS